MKQLMSAENLCLSQTALIWFGVRMCTFNVFEETFKKTYAVLKCLKLWLWRYFITLLKMDSYANLVVLVNLLVLVTPQTLTNIVTSHSYEIINASSYLKMLYVLYWTLHEQTSPAALLWMQISFLLKTVYHFTAILILYEKNPLFWSRNCFGFTLSLMISSSLCYHRSFSLEVVWLIYAELSKLCNVSSWR